MVIRLKYVVLFVFVLLVNIGNAQSRSQDTRLQTSRLILGSKANMLERGNTLLYNINIAYSGIDYGLTKNISVGGGFLYLPNRFIGQLKIKLGHSFNENVHTALVGHYMQDFGSFEREFFAPIFALTTLDFNNFSLTFGPGVAFDETDFILTGQFALMFPIKNKLAFISENYWGYDPTRNTYDDNIFVLNVGVRYFHNKWFFDFAVSNWVLIGGDGNGILPLPALSANYKFN